MRERWIPLSPAGWHNVVTGYIRERQYEMALKTLSHMESQGVAVQDWLYSLIIYNLCDAEEFAEALRLMRARLSGGSELSPNLWLHALDVASAALNEEMTSFVWKRRVETRIINPSYGVCNNVLTIACRTGNTDLATSVFKVIGDRGGSFTQNDYEALIDTYAAAGYTKAAFTVLCVMHKTVGATKTATPALLSHLMWCEAEPAEAWEIVKQLHQEEKRDIPMAAPNVIFQLCERRSRPEAALQIYKELHLVCKPPFPVETFNYLLMVARRTKDLEMASYLMEEMRRQTVFADQTTYTTIIVLCAEIGRFADARNFVVEMTEAGMGLDDGYRRKLVEICSRSSDDPDAQALAHDASVRKPVSRHIDPRKFQARSSLESGKGSKEVVGEAAASAEARTEAA
jgi:pentatricopeptide repeat protein